MADGSERLRAVRTAVSSCSDASRRFLTTHRRVGRVEFGRLVLIATRKPTLKLCLRVEVGTLDCLMRL